MSDQDAFITPTRTRKHWTKSRTIWFNVAILFVSTGTELMTLVDLLSEEHQAVARFILIAATGIGNVILRVITTEPMR